MFTNCSDVGDRSCVVLEECEVLDFVSSAVCSLLGVVPCGGMFSLSGLLGVYFMFTVSSLLLGFRYTLCLGRGTIEFELVVCSCVGLYVGAYALFEVRVG